MIKIHVDSHTMLIILTGIHTAAKNNKIQNETTGKLSIHLKLKCISDEMFPPMLVICVVRTKKNKF